MSLLNKASLIQIPSGYKDGTLYSAKPTNGDGDFTFSRGSNLAATRINSEGLIEKGRENLLLQSNTFDTTWTTPYASVTGGQSGYDGSSDAWLLSKTGDYGRVEQNTSANGIYTLSVYAKSGTLDWLSFENSGISADTCFFDLSNGLLGSKGAGVVSTSIQSIGNGWYRCSAIFNGTFGISRIQPSISDGVVNGTNGNIYIQDAQLEVGLVSTDVITTTTTTEQAGILEDMPRLDYSGGATCPSLILEPSRTNVITQSEYIGAWTESALTITDNNATSPEGVLNAAKLTLPSGSATKRIALGSMPVTAVARSYSFFVKSDDITAVQLVHSGDLQGYARFDISTGVVGSSGTKTTSDIQDYGNGWYRCIANFDSSNAFGSTIYLYISDSATGGYGGSTSAEGDLFVYGAQYEEGSYSTSYIPTYGSSVTRSADFSDDNDIVGSPISFGANDDFTLFYEGSFDDLSSQDNMIMGGGRAQLGASYQNYWWVQSATIMKITGDGEVQLANTTMSLSNNTNYKLLVKRSGSVVDFFVDGSKLTTTQITPNTAFTFRSLGWSYNNAVYKVSGNLKQALVFNSALTDAECIELTTI